MNERSRPNTIEDVAREAGVSVATVSRAMRGLPNVAPSTREHVLHVAERLDYRADPSASRLAAGRTRTVAIAVPLLDSWYFSKVMAGAEAVLSAAGYDLLAFTIDSEERRHRALGGPLVKRVDGVILVDLRIPPDEALEIVARSIPVVTIGFEIAGASSVIVDDLALADHAVEHLVALGHRDIALLGGVSDDPMRFMIPELRRAGYRQALRRHGIEPRARYEAHGNFSVDGGREAMASLLDEEAPPTAVFAMSDEMAFGALREIWDRGLEVPADISVIGVDDHDFAPVVGLTTIQQEVAEHGAVAARSVLDHLMDETLAPSVRRTETTLIERHTTGPVPAHRRVGVAARTLRIGQGASGKPADRP